MIGENLTDRQIKNRKELIEYLAADKKALGISRTHPPLFGCEVWKFQISLRKYEYHLNTKHILRRYFFKFINHYWKIKLGFDIPPNVFGKGLNIHHYGCIVVNANARVGEYCNIQQCVNIGQNHNSEDVPTIGDNVYIGPGAKIFGKIEIADNIAIGAGAVVNKSFLEEGITVAGVPAKKVGKRK